MNRDYRVVTGETSNAKWGWLVVCILLSILIFYGILNSLTGEDSILVTARDQTHSYVQVPISPPELNLPDESQVDSETAAFTASVTLKDVGLDLKAASESEEKETRLGKLLRSVMSSKLPTPKWRHQSNTLVFLVTACGVVDTNGEPVLLTGDFVLPESGDIESSARGVLPVSQLISQLTELVEEPQPVCQNVLLVLDCGHILFDPSLGIDQNDFPSRVAGVPLPERVWILCSNSDQQLNPIDFATRQSVFGEAFALGVQGHADSSSDDDLGQVTSKELFSYVSRYCALKTRGNTTPVLIGSKGAVVISSNGQLKLVKDRSVIPHTPFYVSKNILTPTEGDGDDEDTEATDESEDDEKEKEPAIVKLTGQWNDLIEYWDEIDVSSRLAADEWLPIDVMPAHVKARARDLVYAQTELLSGRPLRTAVQKSLLDDQDFLSRETKLIDQLKDYSQASVKRLKDRYRVDYLAYEFAMLDAKLSTFSDRAAEKRMSGFREGVALLIDNVVKTNQRFSEIQAREVAQLQRHADGVTEQLKEVTQFAIAERRLGILRCLFESPALPSSQRRLIYGLLADEPVEPSGELPDKIVSNPKSGSTKPDPTQVQRLLNFSFSHSGITHEEGYLAIRRYIVAGTSSSIDALDRAQIIRMVDGRESLENYRWDANALYPIQQDGRLDVDFLGRNDGEERVVLERPGVPKEVRLTTSGMIEMFRIKIDEEALPPGLLTFKYSAKPLDPNPGSAEPIKIEVDATDFSNLPEIDATIQIIPLSDKSKPRNLKLKIIPPKKGAASLVLDSESGAIPSGPNSQQRYVILPCFPNRKTAFQLQIQHTFPIPMNCEATVRQVGRPKRARYGPFVLRDLKPDDWEDLSNQIGPSLGTWTASEVAANEAASLVKAGADGEASEQAVGEEPQFAPLAHSLVVDLSLKAPDGNATELTDRIWIGFEIVDPSEYVKLSEPKQVGEGFFEIEAQLRPDSRLPDMTEDPVVVTLSSESKPDLRVESEDPIELTDRKRAGTLRVRAASKESLSVSIDRYPRLALYGPNPELLIHKVFYTVNGNDTQVRTVRPDEKLLFKGSGMGALEVGLRLSKSQWGSSIVEVGLDKLMLNQLHSNREKRIRISIDGGFNLVAESEVTDWKTKIRSHRCESALLVLKENDREPAQTVELEFDDRPPSRLTLSPFQKSDDPLSVKFEVTGFDTNPQSVTLQIREHQPGRALTPEGDEESWPTVAVSDRLNRGNFRAHLEFRHRPKVVSALALNRAYDLRVIAIDQLGNRERSNWYENRLYLAAKPAPVPAKKKPVRAPAKPKPPPPKGKVTVVAKWGQTVLDVDRIVVVQVKNGQEFELEPNKVHPDGFDVSEAGVYKVSLYDLHSGTRLKGKDEFEIQKQEQVKTYPITMELFRAAKPDG